MQSWDANDLGEIARRDRFRQNLGGSWRGWRAAVAVDDQEIEPRVAYLEGIRDSRAVPLRASFEAMRSYCRAVADGSTLLPVEYQLDREARRDEARQRLAAVEARSYSPSGGVVVLTTRVRARSEAARRTGETSWAIEKARADEELRRNQQAFSFEMRSSPEDDPWADRRGRPRTGAPATGASGRERLVVFDWTWSRDQGRVRLEAGIRNVGNGPIEGGRAHLNITNYAGQSAAQRDVLFESRLLPPGGETHLSTLFAPGGSFYRCAITLSDAQGRPLATYRPIDTDKPLLDRAYN